MSRHRFCDYVNMTLYTFVLNGVCDAMAEYLIDELNVLNASDKDIGRLLKETPNP
ncbi:hypothetical protein DSO57_1029440 [Entomophthora muscae]|nr:hypothetical protein DSO57_1029440 [Entomophthora muscae]